MSVHTLLGLRPAGTPAADTTRLSEPLQLQLRDGATGALRPFTLKNPYLCATAAPAGDTVYFCTRSAVWQLDGDNVVSLVAGNRTKRGSTDGSLLHDARFEVPCSMAADGSGALWLVDQVGLRRVQLPAPVPGGTQGLVTTVPCSCEASGVLFDQSRSKLYVWSRTSVHQLSHASGGYDLVPIAGEEGDAGCVDGPCSKARFEYISEGGMAVDSTGTLYLCNSDDAGYIIAQIRMIQDCSVTTVVDDLGELCRGQLAVLPHGWLAVYDDWGSRLILLDMGLSAPSARQVPTPLAEDLSGLLAEPLGGQGSPAPDVAITVGSRTFPAHCLMLSARCNYFRRLFGGPFTDSGAAKVALEDADPAAFESILRWVYTDSTAFPPALLQPIAQLADRLLLPGVSAEAQRQLVESTSPATVVGSMLWAQRMGFDQTLAALKGWYVEHEGEVWRQAPASGTLLFREAGPELLEELHVRALRRAGVPIRVGG